MQDRRTFLGLAAASLVPLPTGALANVGMAIDDVDAQTPTPAPRPPNELARHALSGPFEGHEVVLVELNIPPGRTSSGPGHRHPGAVLGYVVEGQMRFAINNEPEQVLPVGRTFFEPSGAVHTTNGSARTDGPTRAVVFMLVPTGSPLTAPA
jgi:quercetin dioxygenase-like cupin family protein